MKIKITRNTVANRQAVPAGAVLELPTDQARLLIALGKAEGVAEKGPAPETAVLPAVETAVAPVQDGEVKKKGKAKE